MDPFEIIWESSRTNAFSWGYPAFVWAGVGVLVALSLIRNQWLRRLGKLIAIVGLARLAVNWTSAEIEEKWRIRRVWADTHPAEMTQQGMEALTVDGANRLAGPLVAGFQALLIFGGVAACLHLIRIAIQRAKKTQTTVSELDEPVLVTASQPTSTNPYEPPK